MFEFRVPLQITNKSRKDKALDELSEAFHRSISRIESAIQSAIRSSLQEQFQTSAFQNTVESAVNAAVSRQNSALPHRLSEAAGPAPVIEEEEDRLLVPPGQPSIPVNHTTGTARLLLVHPISALVRGIIEDQRIKNGKYPMTQEMKRGLLRLFGRGEGTERLPGYERDSLTDPGSEGGTPSETSSDVTTPSGEE